MTYSPRAALTALAAFALCACATPQKTIPNTGITVEAPEPVSETSMSDSTSKDMASEVTPETTKAPAATETLLYGAMTKYELTTFVEVVRAANLESALEGAGPLTVFAPNNQAFEFARLGANANVPAILKGHIVQGAMNAAALKAAVAENGAPVKMMSVSGQELTVYVMGDAVKIAGPNGTLATITQADMIQSNGVMHHISGVLKPK